MLAPLSRFLGLKITIDPHSMDATLIDFNLLPQSSDGLSRDHPGACMKV